MENVLGARSWQSKQSVTGWGASLVLHVCLALAALVLLPKMAVVVEQQPFTWDVALVEAPHEVVRPAEPAPAPVVQPPAPKQAKRQPVRAVEPPPQPVTRPVQTRVAPQPVQREVQAVVETPRPVDEIQSPQEVVRVQPKQLSAQEIQKTEPLMQAETPAEVKREVAAAVEQAVVESAPVAAQTYETQPVVSAQKIVEMSSQPGNESTVSAMVETTPQPVVTERAPVERAAPVDVPVVEPVQASPPPTVARSVEAGPTAAPEPVPAPPAPTAEPTTQPDPATQQEHQVVASVAPKGGPKADYKWLAESLHRRIIELRHYPSTARLNGWEGKVVLKVSIRHDGQLKDVEVVKSSGHDSLDQAAMEAVRRACPLHMKHELTAPMVVLHLPVSYSLNR